MIASKQQSGSSRKRLDKKGDNMMTMLDRCLVCLNAKRNCNCNEYWDVDKVKRTSTHWLKSMLIDMTSNRWPDGREDRLIQVVKDELKGRGV